MKTGLLIIYCSLLLTGCKSKERIPASVIPPKKMQAILWDMMRADLFLSDFVLNKDTSLNKRKESIKLYQQVFAIHQINKDQFQQSFSFYESRPDLFKAIMDSLSQPSREAPTELAKPSLLPDSVQSSPGNRRVTDSVMPFRKRRTLPLN